MLVGLSQTELLANGIIKIDDFMAECDLAISMNTFDYCAQRLFYTYSTDLQFVFGFLSAFSSTFLCNNLQTLTFL